MGVFPDKSGILIMKRFIDTECEPKLINPLALAFVGDSVYDIFVREKIVCRENMPVKKLHALAVEEVRAQSQSNAAKKILPELREDEKEIFLRGRNAHSGHIPKNSSVEDYHYATALEAVFGYIYLKGDIERLRELFNLIHTE